jgi:hypothetical protein
MGEDENCFNGHFKVLFPSTREGGQYASAEGGQVGAAEGGQFRRQMQ